jgi:beta-galactosidase
MKTNAGVELKEGQYFINGKPFFMFSGEFHYFRVPAAEWPARLKHAKKLGLNTIASYIPWIWHEPEEGKFDFTGKTKPERNLVKFLELVAENGLKFFARPGPVTHGEIQNDGLPHWLVQKPGGINVRNSDGEPCWCPWLPSFFKPVYQEKVTAWYGALMPILKKFQASNNGPVIQIQLDNEIHMINWLGKLADYNPETTQRYQNFLKAKYETIAGLNQAYGTAYTGFALVKQPEGFPEKESWPVLWDWALYYRDHYAGYAEFLANQVRAHGLKTAVSANIAQFVDFNMCGRGWESLANTTVFRDFPKKVPDIIFGGAFQMRHLDFENFHDIVFTVESLKSITNPGIPANCAELQVGVINDRPRIYPSDVELNLKTAAAAGLNGINGYMTFGGQSPDEIQLRGHYHEWQAAVDSKGNFREHAEPLQRFGRFIKSFGDHFSQTKTLHDLTLGFDPHYYFTEFLKGPFFDRMTYWRNLHFFDGTARVAALIGFNPDLLDLERADQATINQRPSLWMYTLEFLSHPVMEKLVAYVKQGGRLVLNPGLPVKNSHMQEDHYLVQEFGLAVDQVRPIQERNYYVHNKLKYMIESDMTLFQETAGSEVLLRNHEGKPCVVRRQVGKGQVLAIGFGLYHQYDYVVEMVRELAAAFGIKPMIEKMNWEVHSVLRVKDGAGWLYAANFHDAPRVAAFKFPLGSAKARKFPSQGSLRLPNRSAYFFPLNLPVAPGVTIVEATCEVLQSSRNAKTGTLELAVRGLPGQETVMMLAMEKPVKKAWLDGMAVEVKPAKGRTDICFLATGDVQTLSVK